MTSVDYGGILQRSPDSAGLNSWVTALTGPSPSLTNQQVSVDFIDSTENINRINTAIARRRLRHPTRSPCLCSVLQFRPRFPPSDLVQS